MSNECVVCGATGEQAVSHQRFGCTAQFAKNSRGQGGHLVAQRDAARARIAELEGDLEEAKDLIVLSGKRIAELVHRVTAHQLDKDMLADRISELEAKNAAWEAAVGPMQELGAALRALMPTWCPSCDWEGYGIHACSPDTPEKPSSHD